MNKTIKIIKLYNQMYIKKRKKRKINQNTVMKKINIQYSKKIKFNLMTQFYCQISYKYLYKLYMDMYMYMYVQCVYIYIFFFFCFMYNFYGRIKKK